MKATADLRALPCPDFRLDLTLNSGQAFHWRRVGPGYAGTIGDIPVYAEQRGEELFVTAGTETLARGYFALDHPLPEIYSTFPDDAAMNAALAGCRGLRVMRQPLWECLATFITSSLKQVAHISRISHTLRERFGGRVGRVGAQDLFGYPTIERVAALDEAALRACGLGFRARSVLQTAQSLAAGGGEAALDALRAMDRRSALTALGAFRGVGTKVANCVLLFGLGHLDAFPIDVWIERVLRATYFRHEPGAAMGKLQQFSEAYFGRYGGYAQQYLFHHARKIGRPPRAGADATAPMRRVRSPRQAPPGSSVIPR